LHCTIIAGNVKMELNEILGKLQNVKKTGQDSYTAICPSHNDKNNS
jgi:hypothetical protein